MPGTLVRVSELYILRTDSGDWGSGIDHGGCCTDISARGIEAHVLRLMQRARMKEGRAAAHNARIMNHIAQIIYYIRLTWVFLFLPLFIYFIRTRHKVHRLV